MQATGPCPLISIKYTWCNLSLFKSARIHCLQLQLDSIHFLEVTQIVNIFWCEIISPNETSLSVLVTQRNKAGRQELGPPHLWQPEVTAHSLTHHVMIRVTLFGSTTNGVFGYKQWACPHPDFLCVYLYKGSNLHSPLELVKSPDRKWRLICKESNGFRDWLRSALKPVMDVPFCPLIFCLFLLIFVHF